MENQKITDAKEELRQAKAEFELAKAELQAAEIAFRTERDPVAVSNAEETACIAQWDYIDARSNLAAARAGLEEAECDDDDNEDFDSGYIVYSQFK